MESIRLEPYYITKYGKEYYELYHANIEVINQETYYKKHKNKFFTSFWEELKEDNNYYYEDYDNDDYFTEEEYVSDVEIDLVDTIEETSSESEEEIEDFNSV